MNNFLEYVLASALPLNFIFQMLRIVILSLVALFVLEAESTEKLMHKINRWNLMARCWGDDNMVGYSVKMEQAMKFCGEIRAPIFGAKPFPGNDDKLDALRDLLANPALSAFLNNQGRRKRQAGLLNPDEEDKMEFMEDLSDFKEGMQTKIGNLTCVLTQMEMLDAAGNINMEAYSLRGMTPFLGNTPAGSDPVFLKKLADGFSDCYDISRNWPQVSLDRNPMKKEHGRHMIFFECAKKVEDMMCTKYEIYKWLEILYGKWDSSQNAELGLPDDKYDAAAMSMMATRDSASDEEMFIDDFFWQKSKF